MSQCKGRYADKECYFQNGRVYYTEKRCTIKAAGKRCSDPELCIRCYKKSCEPFDSKKQSKCYQGKVGGDYFKRSFIFGSPWFIDKNEQEEYTISDEDFRIAKEAQRIAIVGTQMGRKKKEETQTKPTEVKEKKPRAKKSESEVKEKEKKPRTKKENVVVAKSLEVKPEVIVPVAIAVEAMDEPIEAYEVVKIPVQMKTINEKAYWYEPKKQKVYEVKKENGIGKYLGRFDSAEDKIVEFPDSDVDV